MSDVFPPSPDDLSPQEEDLAIEAVLSIETSENRYAEASESIARALSIDPDEAYFILEALIERNKIASVPRGASDVGKISLVPRGLKWVRVDDKHHGQ